MNYHLGINTGFAVNRFSEPEDWVRIAGDNLGLGYIQMTAEMLNAQLPDSVINKYTKRIVNCCNKYNTKINSTFTGAYTRVNHLAHPDAEIRKYWINWFKRFADISVDVGAESMGSHFGIFTEKDDSNPELRNERRKQNIDGWHEIAEYSKKIGLKYLSWEPMSITREQGETLITARELQNDVNKNSPLPFYINLDVDHGDVSSKNLEDTNPYAWLKNFAKDSPLIHLKQSSKNKSGHWPFTKDKNAEGQITPEKVLETLDSVTKLNIPNFQDTYLYLELSFRERQPFDSTVVEVLKESVEFWRTHVKQ